jgi:hypothetical protein
MRACARIRFLRLFPDLAVEILAERELLLRREAVPREERRGLARAEPVLGRRAHRGARLLKFDEADAPVRLQKPAQLVQKRVLFRDLVQNRDEQRPVGAAVRQTIADALSRDGEDVGKPLLLRAGREPRQNVRVGLGRPDRPVRQPRGRQGKEAAAGADVAERLAALQAGAPERPGRVELRRAGRVLQLFPVGR